MAEIPSVPGRILFDVSEIYADATERRGDILSAFTGPDIINNIATRINNVACLSVDFYCHNNSISQKAFVNVLKERACRR